MAQTIIFSAIVIIVLVLVALGLKDKNDIKLYLILLIYSVACVSLFSFLFGAEHGLKKALDGKQTFRKEYTYKQSPSGEYVKTDSIYVRIETEK